MRHRFGEDIADGRRPEKVQGDVHRALIVAAGAKRYDRHHVTSPGRNPIGTQWSVYLAMQRLITERYAATT